MNANAKAALWVGGALVVTLALIWIISQLNEVSDKVDNLTDRLTRPRSKPEDMPPIEVVSESVADAAPKSAIVPVDVIPKPVKPSPAPEFAHSEDFRTVTTKGQTFSLTLYQSRALEKLWNARKNLTPELHQAAILEGIESCSKRLRDIFKSNMGAYRALISPGERKGTFRLNSN